MATDIDTDIDINTFRYLYEIINVVGKKFFFCIILFSLTTSDGENGNGYVMKAYHSIF